MIAKMTDKVRYNEGITTIPELDALGLIEFKQEDNIYSKRTASGVCTKYFASLKDSGGCWEISKTSYLSRTGQKEKIGKVEKLINSEGLEITKEAISTYNRRSCSLGGNDNWNIANGLGTNKENRYLKSVARYYGVDKLTKEDIKRYIEREKIGILV